MILKGNVRGSGSDLARHLMNARDNEHVELHDLRGFVSDDLHGAMQESEAVARGTRCRKHLFSLSLNPPENENPSVEAFEAAASRVESQLGLENQPRAIVFHEKEGRRHAHAVWSRIDGKQMKAIDLPYYKNRLHGVSRELYLEHGWRLPKGFRDRTNRDPLAFTLEEWQQAKRTGADPKLTKSLIRECWNTSDNAQAFEIAMQNKGFWLARGDKRGFVAVDWRGEVYSLSRLNGARSKDLKSRLGDANALLSTDEAKAKIGALLTPKLKAWAREEEQKARKANLAAEFQREEMVQRHRKAREGAKRLQAERWQREQQERADRAPSGIRGLWGWVTGKNRQIRAQNEAEIARAETRDRAEKQALIQKQLAERRALQQQVKRARELQQQRLQELNRDVAHAMKLGRVPEKPPQLARSQSRGRDDRRRTDRGRDPNPT